MKLLVLVIFTGILLLPGVSDADWIVDNMLPTGQIIRTSLLLGSGNSPYIAFCEEGVLRAGFWNGTGWDVVDVATEDNIRACNLALDSSDNPRIVYWSISDYTIYYAEWNGDEWTDTVIDGGEGGMAGPDCALCIDSLDNPMIAYLFHSPDPRLCFAVREGSDWVLSTIDPDLAAATTVSMDLGAGDTPHVAYYDPSIGDLRYAVKGDRFWNLYTVDRLGNVGDEASIAVDGSDRPHISYVDRTIGLLKYAHYDGSEWQVCTVDSIGDPFAIGETSIQVDGDDLPRIVYYDVNSTYLKIASFDGSSWEIDSVGRRGHSSCLAIDSENRPCISYFSYSYNQWGLVYTHWDPTVTETHGKTQ